MQNRMYPEGTGDAQSNLNHTGVWQPKETALSDARGVAQKKPFHVSRCRQKMPISTRAFYPRRCSEQMEVIRRDRQGPRIREASERVQNEALI